MSTRKKYKKLWPCIILEWVVIPFRRGSSQPRDRIQVSCITGSNPGLLHCRIKSRSPALQADSLPSEAPLPLQLGP